MFQIGLGDKGTVVAEGRLDAAQAPKAQEFLDTIPRNCVLDLGKVDYISSAGLGVLLKTHKRLASAGGALKLVNINSHIHDIFQYSGFDKLFDIEVKE
jgi:anti-anti-sigma factor